MTASDYLSQISGYYPSAWPAECAGPRRQKIVSSPGLNIQPDEHLVGHARILEPGRWPVMFVQRAKGELYLQGGSSAGTGSPARVALMVFQMPRRSGAPGAKGSVQPPRIRGGNEAPYPPAGVLATGMSLAFVMNTYPTITRH